MHTIGAQKSPSISRSGSKLELQPARKMKSRLQISKLDQARKAFGQPARIETVRKDQEFQLDDLKKIEKESKEWHMQLLEKSMLLNNDDLTEYLYQN
jgi:hypothetical protein